ncbi:hypothetical protein KKF91_10920 [Myxococcota bacterium]|nr:hypothetical protein [Myxococcota bacterium]MBU1431044.1 hypothetical protein [Myxococcota bacterium]MBU1898631.1 hypothetical protein [Myxococcota bacterium]
MDLNAILDSGPPLVILALFLAPIALVLLRRDKQGASRRAVIGLSALALIGGAVLFFVQFMGGGLRDARRLRAEIETISKVEVAARHDLRGDLKLLRASSLACQRALDEQGLADLIRFEPPEPCQAMRRRRLRMGQLQIKR